MVTFALLQRGWQIRADQIQSFEEYGHLLREKLMAQYFERVGDGQTLSNLDLVKDSVGRGLNESKRASLDSFLEKYLDTYVVYSLVALLDRDGNVIYSREKDFSPLEREKKFPGFASLRPSLFSFLEKSQAQSIPFVSDSAEYTSAAKDRLERVFFTPIFREGKLSGFVALQTNSVILEREISDISEGLRDKLFPELLIRLSNPSARRIEFRVVTADSRARGFFDRWAGKLLSSGEQQTFQLNLVDTRLSYLPTWEIHLSVDRFALLRWSYWLQLIAVLVAVLMGVAIWYVVAIFLRQKDRDQRVFTQGILDAQERERTHLAREIHDGVGQILLAAKIQIAQLGRANPADLARIKELNRSMDLAINEIRTISHGLHPSVLENLSLTEAVKQKVSEIEHVFDDVLLEIDLDQVEKDFSKDFKSNLFRILQEALQNTIKHSEAGMVSVVLQNVKETIRLRVEDDGVGFSHNSKFKSSLGLRSMEERVKIFQGEFRFGNNPDVGGFIECEFDLKEQGIKNANK